MKNISIILVFIFSFTGLNCNKNQNQEKKLSDDSTSLHNNYNQAIILGEDWNIYLDPKIGITFKYPKFVKISKIIPPVGIKTDSVIEITMGGGVFVTIYKTFKGTNAIYEECGFERLPIDSNGNIINDLENDSSKYSDTIWTYSGHEAKFVNHSEWIGLEGSYSVITHYSEAYQKETGMSGSAGLGDGTAIVLVRKIKNDSSIVAIYFEGPQDTMAEGEESKDPKLYDEDTFNKILESLKSL